MGYKCNFSLRRWLRPNPLTRDAGCDAGDAYVLFEVVVWEVVDALGGVGAEVVVLE